MFISELTVVTEKEVCRLKISGGQLLLSPGPEHFGNFVNIREYPAVYSRLAVILGRGVCFLLFWFCFFFSGGKLSWQMSPDSLLGAGNIY